MLELDLYQTVCAAVIALWIGTFLKNRIMFLQRFCIPSPVVGGLLFALLTLAGYSSGLFVIGFDDTLKNLFMVFFFTSVGFQANFKTIKQGGKPLIAMVLLVAVLVVIQNSVAVGIAMGLGLDGLVGLCAGSIPMVGGHGTAGGFGPVLEEMGVTGAMSLTTAAATFGLVAGSLIGGPLAQRLIEKHNLLKDRENIKAQGGSKEAELADSLTSSQADKEKNKGDYTKALYLLIIAVGLGTLVSMLLDLTGMTFPIYMGGLLAGAIIRNIDEFGGNKIGSPMREIDEMGSICLSLFLGIAMISLKLWELAELALPLCLMLGAQILIMILFAYFICFRVMGKDYDAAVLSAGFCGFGMGATPNAMANIQAVCDKYVVSWKAFLIVPIVGSMFTDFVNSMLITVFLNIL